MDHLLREAKSKKCRNYAVTEYGTVTFYQFFESGSESRLDPDSNGSVDTDPDLDCQSGSGFRQDAQGPLLTFNGPLQALSRPLQVFSRPLQAFSRPLQAFSRPLQSLPTASTVYKPSRCLYKPSRGL